MAVMGVMVGGEAWALAGLMCQYPIWSVSKCWRAIRCSTLRIGASRKYFGPVLLRQRGMLLSSAAASGALSMASRLTDIVSKGLPANAAVMALSSKLSCSEVSFTMLFPPFAAYTER